MQADMVVDQAEQPGSVAGIRGPDALVILTPYSGPRKLDRRLSYTGEPGKGN
jgi:hypothetical protein